MPGKDDERTIGARGEGLVRVFDGRIRPPALRDAFEGLWKDMWRDRLSANPLEVKYKDPLWAFQHSWEYQTGLYLALEHLRQSGSIPKCPVFDKEGRLKKDATEEEVKGLFGQDGILKGKKVLVFGGAEAEVFQAMGAEAMGFDPAFKDLSGVNWTAYQRGFEIEELADVAQGEDNGFADLTYSSRLFDPGSGLVDDAGSYAYTMNQWVVLNLTRPGGISIHDGKGALPAVYPDLDAWRYDRKSWKDVEPELPKDIAVRDVQARVLEIATRLPDDKVGDQETTYVLQRK